MAENTDYEYEFDLDDEVSFLSEIDELELVPNDSEIGVHGVTSTLQQAASSGAGPSSSPDAPPEKKRKNPRIVQDNPAVSLQEIIPDAVGILREAMFSNPKLMSTPAGKDISVLREHLNSQSDDTLQPMAEYLLQEVWKVTESGHMMTVGTAANSAMWKSFHKLRLNDDLSSKWTDYLTQSYGLHSSDFTSNMILQEVLKHLLLSVLSRRNVSSPKTQDKETNFSAHDEEVLRYVAGFIPYALSKRYRRVKSKTAKTYLAFLQNLRVSEDEDTHAESFLEYTCVWTTLQNRGGLFLVSDDCYMLFRAMELESRKHLSEDFLVEGRAQPIKEKLQKELTSNVYVARMWEKLQGNDLVKGEGLLNTIINYWVEIRMRALVKMFLDKRRQEIGAQKREKGLRKKLQKKK